MNCLSCGACRNICLASACRRPCAFPYTPLTPNSISGCTLSPAAHQSPNASREPASPSSWPSVVLPSPHFKKLTSALKIMWVPPRFIAKRPFPEPWSGPGSAPTMAVMWGNWNAPHPAESQARLWLFGGSRSAAGFLLGDFGYGGAAATSLVVPITSQKVATRYARPAAPTALEMMD